jgi:8-oxo-dGDP phosphatase
LGVTDEAGGELRGWRTFGERALYESPEVWLGQVDVGLPSRERIWQHVVRLHRAAAVVLLDGQGRALLTWRHRFVQDRWGWELPGGLVDEDEDPAHAAVRELEDQTGYRAGQLEHLVSFQPVPEVADGERLVFVGRDPEHVGAPVSSDEIGRIDWLPLASVPELVGAGQIWGSASVAGLLSVLARER